MRKTCTMSIWVLALGLTLWFFSQSASAQLWWEKPETKSKTEIVKNSWSFQGFNFDRDQEYIWIPPYYTWSAHRLYKTADLIAATTATNTPAMVTINSTKAYWAPKTAALSTDLGRIVTFEGWTERRLNSGPLGSNWTKGVTVFSVSNTTLPAMYVDAGDFDELSEYLYTNINRPADLRGKIMKWNVGNLEQHGLAFTSNQMITTSAQWIYNLDVYNIQGKDLIYYGEGMGDSVYGGQVWVYDTAEETETRLIAQGGGVPYSSLPYGGDEWLDDDPYTNRIVNVKVSGIGTTQMWLYVSNQSGGTNDPNLNTGISIFPLASNGKSVGPKVKTVKFRDLIPALGITYTEPSFKEWLGFEVTNDGKCAFFGNTLYDKNIKTAFLYVVHTPPPMGTTFLIR